MCGSYCVKKEGISLLKGSILKMDSLRQVKRHSDCATTHLLLNSGKMFSRALDFLFYEVFRKMPNVVTFPLIFQISNINTKGDQNVNPLAFYQCSFLNNNNIKNLSPDQLPRRFSRGKEFRNL